MNKLPHQSLHIILVMLFIAYSDVTSATKELFADQTGEDIHSALRRVDELHKTRAGLVSLQNVLHDIDGDLLQNQKRLCVMWGDYSNECALGYLDDAALLDDWMTEMDPDSNPEPLSYEKRTTLLSNRLYKSPPKSNVLGKLFYPVQKRGSDSEGSALGDDVTRKRRGLLILKRILDEMDNDIIVEQKRMCRFNLGGHCATESAAAVADQWHYLNSHLSPGRKRRDTSLYRKLMSGEILKDGKSA